jgi:hypothetical protein
MIYFLLMRNSNKHLESLKIKTNIISCRKLKCMHGWTIWKYHIPDLKTTYDKLIFTCNRDMQNWAQSWLMG